MMSHNIKPLSKSLLIAIILLYSSLSSAENFWVTSTVNRILTEEIYGGCMIAVNVQLPPQCNSGWLSLDCNGTFYDERNANNKFAAALVAYDKGHRVHVYVTDQTKHNGFCVARRLDIFP